MSTTPNLKVSINLWTIQHTEYCSILVLQTINEFVNSLRVEHQEGVMDDTLRVIEFGRCRVESRQGPFQLHSDSEVEVANRNAVRTCQDIDIWIESHFCTHQLADSNEAVMLNSRSKSNPALSSSSDWIENRHLKSANGRWSHLKPGGVVKHCGWCDVGTVLGERRWGLGMVKRSMGSDECSQACSFPANSFLSVWYRGRHIFSVRWKGFMACDPLAVASTGSLASGFSTCSPIGLTPASALPLLWPCCFSSPGGERWCGVLRCVSEPRIYYCLFV